MELTHLDNNGRARMVDVGDKPSTRRTAVAIGEVCMAPETLARIREGSMKKGDVLAVAQVAGITGAKKTADWIPMCHPIFLSGCDMDFTLEEDRVRIRASATTTGPTGIEMEALTAVAAAALTIYDMCKAVDKSMRIEGIRLIEKTGGRSGVIRLEEER